jgi:hypothetical protein
MLPLLPDVTNLGAVVVDFDQRLITLFAVITHFKTNPIKQEGPDSRPGPSAKGTHTL